MTKSPIVEQIRKRIQDPKKICTLGTSDRFRVFPVATEAAIQSAERQLGFTLPIFLRELYLKVGNGGFGPGFGIFGIAGGNPPFTHDGTHHNLVSFYKIHLRDRDHPKLTHDFSSQGSLFLESLEQWFDQLLPICSWGCDHYSLLDCSKEEAPVIHYVGYGGELILEANSLEDWFVDWLNGVDLFGKANNDMAS
jgi:hypothetical protein